MAVVHGPAAEAEGCDLIAMSTHGRSGLVRAMLGSVTEGVVRASGLPTLAISSERARQYWDAGKRISRIIVPLDGSGEGETALPYARELATRMVLEVILVRVTRDAISAPISAALRPRPGHRRQRRGGSAPVLRRPRARRPTAIPLIV